MSLLLTDGEIDEVWAQGMLLTNPKGILHTAAKAQAKKIAESLLSGIAVELDADQSLEEFYNNIHQKYHKWQALKKDLGF